MASAQEHLKESAESALRLFDAGKPRQAITEFLSDMKGHSGTAHIGSNFDFQLLLAAASEGHDAFWQVLSGFAVR